MALCTLLRRVFALYSGVGRAGGVGKPWRHGGQPIPPAGPATLSSDDTHPAAGQHLLGGVDEAAAAGAALALGRLGDGAGLHGGACTLADVPGAARKPSWPEPLDSIPVFAVVSFVVHIYFSVCLFFLFFFYKKQYS